MITQDNELHDWLMNLKNLSNHDQIPVDYKEGLKTRLKKFRSDIPLTYTPSTLEEKKKNIVFYSFMESPHKPQIGEHEYKRLKISWSSLRKHNKDIEVRFCYSGAGKWVHDTPGAKEKLDKWKQLAEEYDIDMYPFHESFTGEEPNAWCIHRWYNLALWENENLNVLYMDADTYVHGDIQQLFDIYSRDPVYGREECGFRHDPNYGVSGEDPRFFLDLVDASILAQGGKTEVQKYCLGVILLNHSVHKLFTPEILSYYTELLTRIHNFEVFYSIPNYRIMDEFAFWILLSRWSLRTSLFGNQDVSQTFMEVKHETHFNPLVLHYTTKDEEKFADWAPEFFGLSRNQEEREESDLAAGGIYNVNPVMREELAMSMW